MNYIGYLIENTGSTYSYLMKLLYYRNDVHRHKTIHRCYSEPFYMHASYIKFAMDSVKSTLVGEIFEK